MMHFVNLGQNPENVIAILHLWPFVSGALLCLIMVLMYGAVSRSVKGGHFEIFWYSHHLFIAFFILILLHGRDGIGPNYWKYFLVPGTIYIFERIYREYSAYRPVAMVSVTNMNDVVMILEFDRQSAFQGGFKEGQYVFINSPHLSKGEWHPFTISSAPQASTTTLHIRVQGPGSWTRGLLDYLMLMGPPNEPHFRLTTQRGDGSEQGRVLGPDGKQILRIYGPLAAPTQHITEYEVDMIIGAGIGVTPVCSTLQSVVHHLWKFSTGTVFPSHAYFFWVVSYNDIESFRWMVRIVKRNINFFFYH
jgi:predicted ferric reductase